jgi:hypothetical protein
MYVYDAGQAMNAFAQGAALGDKMRNRKTMNAFAGYLKDKDYAGAQDYALGRGSLELAKYAETQGAAQTQQADAQKAAKLGQLKSLTENMLTIPEAQRGEFLSSNWQDIEPIVGTDFMTFHQAAGGDYSDASLNEDLAMFRAQLGEGPPGQDADPYTLAPGAVRFGADNQVVAKNPKVTEAEGPDWERVTINQNGVPTIVEYDRNAPDPQATMRPIGSEYVKPDPDTGRPDAAGEGQFRREFNSLTKDFRAVHESYNRITATDTSTPAGQMGLIFQYMKMLDPGSTVREGEYATAQNTTGVPGQVLNAYNKAIEGEFLNKNQILDFESQAKNLYDRAAQIYGDRVKDYRRLADEYEFSPDRTVVDVRGFFEPSQGIGGPDAPPPGVDPQDWEYMTPEERALWGNG